jgi:hypothetical protein
MAINYSDITGKSTGLEITTAGDQPTSSLSFDATTNTFTYTPVQTRSITAANIGAINYENSTTTAYRIDNDDLVANPFSNRLHNRFAFLKGISTVRTFEQTSNAGTSWTDTGSFDMRIWSGKKDNDSITFADSATHNGARWTLKGDLNYCDVNGFIITFGRSTASTTVNTIIETSNDDFVTSTEIHNSTTTVDGGVRVVWCPVDYWGNNPSVRITMLNVDGVGEIDVVSIEGMTPRYGAQGGDESSPYPYTWNENGDITVMNDLTVPGSLTLQNAISGTLETTDTITSGNHIKFNDGAFGKRVVLKGIAATGDLHDGSLGSADNNIFEFRRFEQDIDGATVEVTRGYMGYPNWSNDLRIYGSTGIVKGTLKDDGVTEEPTQEEVLRYVNRELGLYSAGSQVMTLGKDFGFRSYGWGSTHTGNFTVSNYLGSEKEIATATGGQIRRALLNASPEQDPVLNPGLYNDLGHYIERGGAITPVQNYAISGETRMFNGKGSYAGLDSTLIGADEANACIFEMDLDLANIRLQWSTAIGIGWGAVNFGANGLRVETSEDGGTTWATAFSSDDPVNDTINAWGRISQTGTGANRIRVSIWDPRSAAEVRIAHLWAVDFASDLGHGLFVGRDGGDIYGSLNISDTATLGVLTAAPASPVSGMIAVADGVTWDPAGTGTEACVVYLGGSWRVMANA